MTDLLKAAVDKFFGFVAPVMPGAAVLVLFGIHHPEWASTFRDITYLGYQTKLFLVLVAALIAGWTASAIYAGTVGFVEGVLIGTLEKWLQGEDPKFPPWRNKNWRALVTAYLGSAAPADLDPVDDETFKLQIETANLITDPQRRGAEVSRVRQAKASAAIADSYWKAWWHTLHQDLLQGKDPVTQLSLAISVNLEATGAVLLCAVPSTPALNQWWIISPSVFWLVTRALRTFSKLREVRDPWSSFSKQMDYLRSQLPSGKAKAQASADPN